VLRQNNLSKQLQQTTGTLGIDQPIINQIFARQFEKKLNKLYQLQKKLIKQNPKDLAFQLENINKMITSVVNDSDNRIVGVLLDEKTLKPSLYGNVSGAKYALDHGFFDNTLMKDLTRDQIKFINEVLVPQSIANEKAIGASVSQMRNINEEELLKSLEKSKATKPFVEETKRILKEFPEITEARGVLGTTMELKEIRNILKNLPKIELDKIATAVNCKTPAKKSEGGRIGFGAGSVSMLTCIDAKWEKDPKGFLRATKDVVSRGLDTLWKYAAPYWLPAVIVATGRLESFKEPTKPDMWWEIFLASDAVKRLGLDKVQLSQLKNASLIKKADILGKLALSGGAWGDKILTKAAKVAKPLLVLTESLSAVKGIKSELDLVKEYALKNNIPYEKAKLAYYASGAALKPRWEGDKSFKSWAFSKIAGGSTLYAYALENWNNPEFQQRGKDVHQYVKENKPVEEKKVTEKVTPHGTGPENWALNMKAQMKEKEPPKYAAVDSYFMGGIASLMK